MPTRALGPELDEEGTLATSAQLVSLVLDDDGRARGSSNIWASPESISVWTNQAGGCHSPAFRGGRGVIGFGLVILPVACFLNRKSRILSLVF